LVIQVVLLFLGFLRIKVIFHVCLPILSDFLENWRWSPRVLSVFTDFLSWLSRIYTKKAPSGAEKSFGASNAVFSGKIGTPFKSLSQSWVYILGITPSPDLPLSGPHGKPIPSRLYEYKHFLFYRELRKLQAKSSLSGLFRLFGLSRLSGLFRLFGLLDSLGYDIHL